MKKILMLLIIGFLSTQLVYSQSLADVAKKEKERREQNQKEGKKVKVVTNEDIAKMKEKEGPPVTSTETPGTETTTDQTTEPKATPIEPREESKAPVESAGESEQQKILAQMETLQAEIEQLKKQKADEQAKLDAGGMYLAHNPGQVYKNMRDLDDQIKAKEVKISDLELQIKEE